MWYFGDRIELQESTMTRIEEETVQKLRQEFLRIEMPGMVALIDHLWEMEKAGTPWSASARAPSTYTGSRSARI